MCAKAVCLKNAGKVKAEKFNEKASRPESKASEIIAALELKRGQTVADLGCGGGYFSLRFAEKVGERGRVYAVDVNPEFLAFVSNAAEEKCLKNVKPILADEKGFSLPKKAEADVIFARNAYHHLRNRTEYFRKLKKQLKRGGRIAIVEYTPGRFFSFRRLFRHCVPEKTIENEMQEAGYGLVKRFDFLETPKQSFTVYARNLKKPRSQKYV
jgi:ubiquinone/menaquinone biosynthesis C-methylase UbiE